MHYSIDIINWFALAPGLNTQSDWQHWANQQNMTIQGELTKSQKIPMMSARRMSVPSRLAVETGLTLAEQQPDAAIFISRHGELERTYKIITHLTQNTDISPTDFAMSVHNTAAGLFTITAKNTLPITSLAAGCDGFQQGLIEAQAMLSAGAKTVLLIDFDGLVPDAYHATQDSAHQVTCYAVGFLIKQGKQLQCQSTESVEQTMQQNLTQQNMTQHTATDLPQSLFFLKHWLNKTPAFAIKGFQHYWQWIQ